MFQDEYEPATFLANVTGFESISQDLDFGAGVLRLVATGAPKLREPTFGIRKLDLTLRVPLPNTSSPSDPSALRTTITRRIREWAHRKSE